MDVSAFTSVEEITSLGKTTMAQYGENKLLISHCQEISPPVFFHPLPQLFFSLLIDPLREEILCVTVQKSLNVVFRDTYLERDNW